MELLNDYPFFILSSSEEFFLQYQNYSQNNYINRVLSVNIFTGQVKSENPDILKEKVIYSTYKAKAILGLIKIKNVDFFLYVTSSEKVCQMKNQDIYKITEVDFFEISDQKINTNSDQEITDLMKRIDEMKEAQLRYSKKYKEKLGLYDTEIKRLKNELRNIRKNLENLYNEVLNDPLVIPGQILNQVSKI